MRTDPKPEEPAELRHEEKLVEEECKSLQPNEEKAVRKWFTGGYPTGLPKNLPAKAREAIERICEKALG